MFVTIRQLLSLMDGHEYVTVFNNGNGEEFSGTVEECQIQLPNAVLDSYISNMRTLAYYGEGVLEIYREVRK